MLVAVLSVWGIFGYKIISTLSPVRPETHSQQLSVTFNPKPAIVNDTFSIEPVLRDPFLGTIKNKKVSSVITTKRTVSIEWPKVIYGGMVKKQNTNAHIFVLNINDTQHLLKKGQRVNDITVVRGNSKEVVIRYKNEPRTITLQE